MEYISSRRVSTGPLPVRSGRPPVLVPGRSIGSLPLGPGVLFCFFKTRKASSFLAIQKRNAPVRAVSVPRPAAPLSLFGKGCDPFCGLLGSSGHRDIIAPPSLAFLQGDWPPRGVPTGHVLCPTPSEQGRKASPLLLLGSFINLCPEVS